MDKIWTLGGNGGERHLKGTKKEKYGSYTRRTRRTQQGCVGRNPELPKGLTEGNKTGKAGWSQTGRPCSQTEFGLE